MISYCTECDFLLGLYATVETVKMQSLYKAYGKDCDFLSFWKQTEGENIGAVIMRFCDEITLYYCGGNREELKEFLRFLGGSRIFCSLNSAKKLSLNVIKKVNCCIRNKERLKTEKGKTLTYNEIYNVLNSDTTGELILPQFNDWYVDFCHRVRHNTARYFSLFENSVIITAYETENYAIIGGVATKPDFRNKGYASKNLTALCGILHSEDKKVLLLCSDKNLKFYEKNGFSATEKYTYAEI